MSRVSQSSLESRTVSVGKILSRVGCSGTQAEEPLAALCCVVKCVQCNPINPVDNPIPVYSHFTRDNTISISNNQNGLPRVRICCLY
jgi:hypothetical protein